MTTVDTYQGFANWETWLIALTFDNDRNLYNETQNHFYHMTAEQAEALVRLWCPNGVEGMEVGDLDVVDFADLAEHWNEK